MAEVCDLQVHINGQQAFFLNEKTLSRFSGKLRKMIKQEKRRTQIRNSGIEIDDFPGGSEGFELVSRFCYNNGSISISVSNVSLLHCCAVYLGMNDSLLQQTERFLEGMFECWSWNDVLMCLKSCETFFAHADSAGLIQKLISTLLAKIALNSDLSSIFGSSSTTTASSNSSSSPDRDGKYSSGNLLLCRLSRSISSKQATINNINKYSSSSSSSNGKLGWWFDDMTVLGPVIVERFVQSLGAYGSDKNSLLLTRFLLHYLKTAAHEISQSPIYSSSRCEYGGLADTAVHGVVLMGKSAFSCRGLFWVLRIVSSFGVSRECRGVLERLIGGMLDEAKLDDLLVCGHTNSNIGSSSGVVYDVNLVLRLIRVFVHRHNNNSPSKIQRMKKVGELIDKYLGEIAPDQNLKISKFLGVAQSLADCARDCFDGVYRAIDIYLESHPCLSLEERSRLCRCLNYEKLSLEACKELAKNPRIPPRIAVQALASQHSNIPTTYCEEYFVNESPISSHCNQLELYNNVDNADSTESFSPEVNDIVKLNLQKMQWRVVELEKVCREMKGHMSRMVKDKVIIPPTQGRQLPRLC